MFQQSLVIIVFAAIRWNCVSAELDPFSTPQMIYVNIEQHEKILTGHNQKSCPNASLSTINPIWTALGANPGLRSDKRRSIVSLIWLTWSDSPVEQLTRQTFYFWLYEHDNSRRKGHHFCLQSVAQEWMRVNVWTICVLFFPFGAAASLTASYTPQYCRWKHFS
jgi:hypothetical protein